MLANQLLGVLVGCLASVGIFHIVRRLVLGGKALTSRRSPAVEEERLSRIEQALESVTIEMERVSEAQRFTSRLLLERLPERQAESLPQRAVQRPSGTITPH